MAQFKRIFYQDLTKKRIIHHCEDVVFGGDNLSDKIGVYLYDNGEPYAGGGTVSGTVINSRGQTVPITTGEISGNLVSVTLEEAALAVPGIIGVYVKLTSGQQIATVLSAMFSAMPTETDQTIDPGTIIPSVSQLITDIETARDSIPPVYTELLAAVAPTFSASTAYTAGSYVWQGGSLYRFTADHAAGSWTGTDAAAAVLGSDVSNLKSETSSALQDIQTIKDLTIDTETGTSSVTLLTSATGKRIDTSTGAIVDSSVSPSILDSFKMVDEAISFTFTAYQRLSGENQYAFYSAETFAECGSSTLVGTVESYNAAVSNTVDVPSGAKIVVIRARQSVTDTSCTYTIESAKADILIADVYSTQKVYNVGDYCMYEGVMYRRTVYTGTYGEWDSNKWEQTKPAKELHDINERFNEKQYFDHSLFQVGGVDGNHSVTTTIKYQVVNTNLIHVEDTITVYVDNSFELTIYYYDSNGVYISNNGGLSTFDARTILKDRYVRLRIGKNNVYDTLSANDIPIFVNALSFDSNYKKTQEKLNENSEGAMKALEAEMFQKGGSPVSFANAPCILVAGQSNIDGRVPAADLPTSVTPPFGNIYYNSNSLDGAFNNPMNTPTYWGIDFSLYSSLNELATPWYVIKRSRGGTSISPYGDSTYHWTPFYEELDDVSKSLLLTFNKQIVKCAEVNPNTYDIRALIWQQGEGDRASTSKVAALDYYKNFKCLIAYIRGITKNEKLPVVCGTVSHLSGQYDPIVEEATLKVAEEDPYMTCIDMSGATLLDSYHFDAECAIYFGYKAYDALIDFGVVSGTKINPTPPWET